MSTMTTYQPDCRRGHGPMRRASTVSTGLWPSWLWICSLWRTCDVTEREPAVEPARYGQP